MPFHMCEKRHSYVCPLNLEVTSNAPMNWLIAPVFASTGRVVTQSPSPGFHFPFYSFSPIFLSADRRRGFHLRVTLNRRSHARAARHPESLIEQALFQRRQKQQHVRLLAAIAHQPYTPDHALHFSESSGNLDIELVEQLIAHLHIINAVGNHHPRDRRQTARCLLHHHIHPPPLNTRPHC